MITEIVLDRYLRRGYKANSQIHSQWYLPISQLYTERSLNYLSSIKKFKIPPVLLMNLALTLKRKARFFVSREPRALESRDTEKERRRKEEGVQQFSSPDS
ncbi:hypothetical protein KPH14_006105 [Odynerus spinipes]|uniref:Uncharacterized protein n=1 Tax=Odynerus spinipes TaxID=1348599 RepID=A0AAD9RJS3_9HYME|nr:hypothetical protein KPH14_006105 [Odynerus spinipes]